METNIKNCRENTGTGLIPREQMPEAIRKLRDTYNITPGAPMHRQEFGYYCLDAWKEQGLPENADLEKFFNYDPPGRLLIAGAGWTTAPLEPLFEKDVIEDRGETQIIRDSVGRHVLIFKDKKNSFMPEFIDHPVKDQKSWEEQIKWRLDPKSPDRYKDLDVKMKEVQDCADKGMIISQQVSGGYMYLRSLIGPETLLYTFYDQPDLIHDCMKTWFDLADAVIAAHQKYVTIDELFFGEDICYNHGPLISPEMINEFLFPYYRELVNNLKKRQLDKQRKLFIHVDTDGFAPPVIPIYKEAIGLNVMSPFEVASGCDVVEIGRNYPDLVISGGIDKRILAGGIDDIDRHLEYILPAMRERGGYIPTCDHGVPAEVPLKNYLHYRKRCVELGG